MEIITHGAFEYFCVQLKVNPGDVINLDPIYQNLVYSHPLFDHITVQTKNNNRVEYVDTGEIYTVYEGESFYQRKFQTGTFRMLNENYYELFCIGPNVNPNYLPLVDKFEPFTLLEGQSITIPRGKRIFMMDGFLEIAGKNYKGTNRLSFVSGDKRVVALKNTYGLYVK